jgi:cytoplasmic iron level regulating protein YaaA (DUF328/UPF0246 family)
MVILLSPAKIQNFKSENCTDKFTKPEFMKEAQELVELMRDLSPSELSNLLDINANLTQLNFDRYFNWHLPFSLKNAKQAVLVFDGEVYRGLNAKTFSEAEFDYAQNHLLLFSGLYGLLRPLDLIQPYRLEVSSKLKNEYGNDLYAFWRNKITTQVNKMLKKSGKPNLIINLASSEYFKSLDTKLIAARIIDVEFYQYKNDTYKQIVIYTKKARGLMARYIIENRVQELEDLKGFSDEGYWFSPQMSTENKLVFTR